MQDVKLNPNASMRYWMEADKLEAQQLEVCFCVYVWCVFTSLSFYARTLKLQVVCSFSSLFV